jgi:hypothetical protein
MIISIYKNPEREIIAFVAGRKRVPYPAAGKRHFLTDFKLLILLYFEILDTVSLLKILNVKFYLNFALFSMSVKSKHNKVIFLSQSFFS